jgi:ribose/xylose/arabinose/galactoside ABC-type transport system permease subunit
MTAEDLAISLAILIAGVINVPLTNFLKAKLNIDDTSALALSIATAILVAFVAMLVTGAITGAMFTWANLPAVVTAVWGVATLVYNILEGKRKADLLRQPKKA